MSPNQTVKITLDHNCLIDLKQSNNIGVHIRTLLTNTNFEFYIVNVGASEMCENREFANNYETFEAFLKSINLAHLPRLDPLFIWDFSYWDHCIYAEEPTVKLSEDISKVLFNTHSQPTSSKDLKKWRNSLCDIQTMWCHIYYGNDIFLTTDNNFMKISKINKLINIGAKNLCHPLNLLEKH